MYSDPYTGYYIRYKHLEYESLHFFHLPAVHLLSHSHYIVLLLRQGKDLR